jgi:hypothetical protein
MIGCITNLISGGTMNQSAPLYDTQSALVSLEPWLDQYLPTLDAGARRHFIQLVTGITEQHSLLLRAIASSSVFPAEPESNFTQVQRIIQDTRLTLETVYYPFLTHLLATIPGDTFYITLDETNQGKLFNLVLVGWATDGVSLPLGFLIYPIDGTWADDARTLLKRLATIIPSDKTIILLADRVHAGDAFLACLDTLAWGYVVRLAEDTFIETERDGWIEMRHLRQRAGRMRVFTNVRIWKGATRRATICLYRVRTADGSVATWYLVTNLAGEHTRFVEYACRWWQECIHKLLKSGFFDWEDSRVSKPPRVTILLMGFGCACWALWLLGRTHEKTSQRKSTTTKSQPRRRNVIKWGWEILRTACKRRTPLSFPAPPAPRVLTYQRRFPGYRLSCDASMVELW